MFSDRVVFVFGAGSNLEHEFMLGAKLKQQIVARVRAIPRNNGQQLSLPEFLQNVYESNAWRLEGFDPPRASSAAAKIAHGLDGKDSIDEFLDAHVDDPAVNALGKFAIVDSILTAERNSKLAFDRSYADVESLELKDGAYFRFWKNLTRNLKAQELGVLVDRARTPLTIITFNYDRSLEQFLFRAFAQTYGLQAAQAAQLVRGLEIIHVYGAIGTWGYGLHDTAQGVTPYGFAQNLFAPRDDPKVRCLAKEISTYTEQTSSKVVDRIRACVALAKQIYFVGMGYHEQNMQLLIPTGKLKATVVAGTGVGESGRYCSVVSEKLRERCNFVPPNLDIVKEGRTCADLFSDFRADMQAYAF